MQRGTPVHVLQELGGWSNVEMVRRYAHLSVEHLAEYAERLSGHRTNSGTVDSPTISREAKEPTN